MRKLIKAAAVATALFTAQSQAMEVESDNMEALTSNLSACTLCPEQQNPTDDPIHFTIRNESSFDIPVDLTIWSFDKTPGYLDINSLCKIPKYVKKQSESYFRAYECALFKQILEAYKVQKPTDCEYKVHMSFNMDIPKEDFFSDNYLGATSCHINPNYIPYGRTYIIKPDGDSFEISQKDS